MFNLGAMLTIALIVGLIIYMQIKKIGDNLDEIEQNPDMSRYLRFCDKVLDEIEGLGRKFQLGDVILRNDVEKEQFFTNLDGLKNEIIFIKDMHQNNKNQLKWEEKLFEFLNKFEKFVNECLENNEAINDDIRDRLQKEFKSL